MAILRPEVSFNFEPIRQLAIVFPELNGRFLSLVGKRARTLLKDKYLSGQEITLRKFPTDARGRRTIVSDVNKRRTSVKVYSYPVNLFERGRTLRDGSREAGKFIITKKLKMSVMSGMAGYVREFETRILEPGIKKAGL